MKIDQKKMRELVERNLSSFSPDDLRREENIFFVGGNLPERQTIETLFESHFQSNATLFHLTFGSADTFQNGETLARMIKKNFNVHLVGRFDYAAPPHLVERAYVAGVDILDIPLNAYDRAASGDSEHHLQDRLGALAYARTVFPRWSVVSTLIAGEEPPQTTMARIDSLLAYDVVPLVQLSGRAGQYPAEEVAQIFTHLQAGWRKKKAMVKPLLPLIYLFAPFVPAAPRGFLRGVIDSFEDRRLLATSDLRRLLRVKEVAESYESSGL